MKRVLACVMFFVAALIIDVAPAHADACGTEVTITQVAQQCIVPGSQAHSMLTTTSSEHHVYRVEEMCGVGGQAVCADPEPCVADDGQPGYEYTLYEDGAAIAQTCMSKTQAVVDSGPSPAQVMTAAKNLTWPQATLVIQPPGGETLVNFATNFYSTTTAPVTQRVTLLGTTVTIEATPSTYTWHFGDGAQQRSTEAGAAYPKLTITHRYLRKGAVRPSVDLTYAGRYRFGDGDWQPLPDTVTVVGTPQDLTVLTATPHLVGDGSPTE